jgi:hypothetical protein
MIILTHKKIGNFDFDVFLEALLIKFDYYSDVSRLEIVSDFINWDLDEDKREFKKISFEGVNNFKRLIGKNIALKDTKDSYHIDNYQGTHAIQKIQALQIDDDHWKFIIKIDTALGGFEFECKSIIIYSKIARGEQTSSDQWIYYDSDTGERFEFSDPFPSA